MKLIKVETSNRDGKKYQAIFLHDDGRRQIVHFGAEDYSDYLQHKDKERRERYRKRHLNAFINIPNTPAALSWHLLWGPSTSLNENIRIFKSRLNV